MAKRKLTVEQGVSNIIEAAFTKLSGLKPAEIQHAFPMGMDFTVHTEDRTFHGRLGRNGIPLSLKWVEDTPKGEVPVTANSFVKLERPAPAPTEPLWQKLDRERTQGEWAVINGWNEKGEGKYFPSLTIGPQTKKQCFGGPRVIFNESHDQEISSLMANAKISALSVNNLAQLAKALAPFAAVAPELVINTNFKGDPTIYAYNGIELKLSHFIAAQIAMENIS